MPAKPEFKRKDKHTAKRHGHSRTDAFDSLAKEVACHSGRPLAFVIAVAIIAIWAITGPIFQFNDTWQLVINTGTTIVTFLMVFLIQNTQNRDAEAVQLKLDEIIRAIDAAENEVMSLEDKSQEELDEIKERYSKLAAAATKEMTKRRAS